ncbi:MAG: hypothetical protein IJQ86_00295 [Spirochaetia bacterium]|nr:hypothetical protein [Spirochaetia bacterium]
MKVRYIGEEQVDLRPGKIYDCLEIVKDKDIEGHMRIVDESGEDYYYSPENFEIVFDDLPKS